MKVNGVKSFEDFAKEVSRLTQEHYPNLKITEAQTRQVLRIFQQNLYNTIIERAGKPPLTYSHAHQKIKYHIRLGGIFLLLIPKWVKNQNLKIWDSTKYYREWINITNSF
jgi:hypothetical protein